MLVTMAQNTTLVADSSSATVMTTDPMPIGNSSLNACMLTANVHRAFAMGGSSTFTLKIVVQGSNDGQNWHDTTAEIEKFAEGNYEQGGACEFAFARLQATLTVTSGDWAMALFDAHVNFVST